MNNGKICVSVCAETAEKLIEQIKQAEELADVIEIRFDCLNESEFDLTLQKIDELNCKKPFLATFRPKSKDAELRVGKRIFQNEEEKEQVDIALDYRFDGWEKIARLKNVEFVDFETDLGMDLMYAELGQNLELDPTSIFSLEADKSLKKRQIIFSEHDFAGVPDDLDIIYKYLPSEENNEVRNDVGKIAIQANNITDSIAIWKLLERAKLENKEFIPIAMGEAGKWTRILGLAHGAFMTYASLDSGNETAPGQVSARDLIEVYRAKELDEKTVVYGIIGHPVAHSVSPEMQNAAFQFHKLNAVYIPFEVNDLDEFIRRMVKPETREVDLNFKGFSVTIPHKQSIIKHLDFIDETAQIIGAVNTVKIVDDKLHGYNTDAQGFIEPLQQAYGDLHGANVAILGAGGSARACVYALKKEGASVTIFARDIQKAKSFANEFEINVEELPTIEDQKSEIVFNNFDIVVNSTPLGMQGKSTRKTPAVAPQLENVKLVYDLIFNPIETQFMKEANKISTAKIGGLAMLIAQGAAQFKIWTGLEAPQKEMNQAALRKLQR